MTELTRQVDRLVELGYPAMAGLSEEGFRRELAPLDDSVHRLPAGGDGTVPFVVVVTRDLVPPDAAFARVELRGKPSFTDMDAAYLASFRPIESVELPAVGAYLLTDVDTGRATLNVTPDAALETIAAEGRSPLTVEEGIALVTHYPELLKSHNCFSLLGSRRGDRRVPALWVKAGGNPRLGWCWAGNPHTWLGSASCAARVGASRTYALAGLVALG